jgi:hypothetical protein
MLFFLRGHPWCDDCCIFSTRSLPQHDLCLAIPLLRKSWGLASFDSKSPLELLTFSIEPIVTVQGVGVNSLSIRCAWVFPLPPVPTLISSPSTFKISFFWNRFFWNLKLMTIWTLLPSCRCWQTLLKSILRALRDHLRLLEVIIHPKSPCVIYSNIRFLLV